MQRSMLLKTIRDGRTGLIWWSIGLVAAVLVNVLFYPSFKDQTDFNKLLEGNEGLKAFTGQITSLTSPQGYLDSQLFFLMVPLLLLIYAIAAGSFAIAGEEGRGTLGLLAANPKPRWRIVFEKWLAMLLMTAILTGVVFLATWLGSRAVAMDISAANVLAATSMAGLLGLLFGTLALAIGALTGQRGIAVGAASAAAVLAYFINALAPLVKELAPYQKYSPFDWYIGHDPITNGVHLADIGLLFGATVVLVGVAVAVFQRRDLHV